MPTDISSLSESPQIGKSTLILPTLLRLVLSYLYTTYEYSSMWIAFFLFSSIYLFVFIQRGRRQVGLSAFDYFESRWVIDFLDFLALDLYETRKESTCYTGSNDSRSGLRGLFLTFGTRQGQKNLLRETHPPLLLGLFSDYSFFVPYFFILE